jgi:hypothetical protein
MLFSYIVGNNGRHLFCIPVKLCKYTRKQQCTARDSLKHVTLTRETLSLYMCIFIYLT